MRVQVHGNMKTKGINKLHLLITLFIIRLSFWIYFCLCMSRFNQIDFPVSRLINRRADFLYLDSVFDCFLPVDYSLTPV